MEIDFKTERCMQVGFLIDLFSLVFKNTKTYMFRYLIILIFDQTVAVESDKCAIKMCVVINNNAKTVN